MRRRDAETLAATVLALAVYAMLVILVFVWAAPPMARLQVRAYQALGWVTAEGCTR